jgi:TolB-like protein
VCAKQTGVEPDAGDPLEQYLADGITEDLTIDLSRIAHMFVISRNTAFTYKDKPVNAKQIGRELGVRYVLEGSVQRSGNRVRVNTQLIAPETDAHLWAERFDREMGDLLVLQDEITRAIAGTLNAQLIAAEAARPTEHPDAVDHILRARAAWEVADRRELSTSDLPFRAGIGAQSAVRRGADLAGGCALAPHSSSTNRLGRCRPCTRGTAGETSTRRITSQFPCSL